MIRKSKSKSLVLNLDGQDGNAFVLLGIASSLCKRSNIDSKPILDEMRSSDYTNLVKTFDKYFGSVVVLETNQTELLKALSK